MNNQDNQKNNLKNVPEKREPRRSLLDFPLSAFPSLWQGFETGIQDFFGGQKGLSMYEDNKNFVVEASMPGLKADSIDVNINKGVLWIRGEQKEEEEDKDRKYYRQSTRSYSYQTLLPEQVDDKQEPQASYKDGILKIEFAKHPVPEEKKIKVKGE